MTNIALYRLYLTSISICLTIVFPSFSFVYYYFLTLSHNYVSRNCLNSIPPAHLKIWPKLYYLVCISSLSHYFHYFLTISTCVLLFFSLYYIRNTYLAIVSTAARQRISTYDQNCTISPVSRYSLTIFHNIISLFFSLLFHISLLLHTDVSRNRLNSTPPAHLKIWPKLHYLVGNSLIPLFIPLLSHYDVSLFLIVFSLSLHTYVSGNCFNSTPPAHFNIWPKLHYLVGITIISLCIALLFQYCSHYYLTITYLAIVSTASHQRISTYD